MQLSSISIALSSISIAITHLTGGLFSPRSLFTPGVTGAWYDPSDLTTLYRDSAGTLPVTAVEQPVGLMRDKSGRNNHAFNPSGNSANFPVLSARYNLLTKTEDFSDAVWVQYLSATKSGTSVCTINFGSGTDSAIYQTVPANSVSTQYTYSATVKSSTGKKFRFALYIGGSTVLYSPDITTTANFVTYSYTFPANALTGSPTINIMNESAGGTGQIEVKQPDLRVANDALNQPAYQRVNTASDYDTVGFKPYLKFNGTNQWLQTNNIDFSYGDKMFVSAGVRKLSDASLAILAELSDNYNTNNGSFFVTAPDSINSNGNYGSASRGNAVPTAGHSAPSSTLLSPITSVLSATHDIIGDLSALRINGSPNGTNGIADKGAGNFGNHPLYIGARAGTSLWFNGRLHQLVVTGKQASASEIGQTEAFTNQKTGAY